MGDSKIGEVLEDLDRQVREAGNDPRKLREAISTGAAIVDASGQARDVIRALLEKAFLAGVDPRDVYEKPYTASYVRLIYNELRNVHPELPEIPKGPRRRIPRT